MKRRRGLWEKANAYADINIGKNRDREWHTAQAGYAAGWLAANRQRYAELRVTVERRQATADDQRGKRCGQ